MFARGLIILWVAFLGVDRIDLLGGRGPILLLPFQVLTAAVVAAEWTRRWRLRQLPAVAPQTWRFAALLLALLTVIGASILRSADVTMSLGRSLLLAATAVGVPLAVWGLADRDDALALLGRGAQLGLLVAVLFDIAQVLAVVGLVDTVVTLGPADVHLPLSFYDVLPRFGGGAADMNRGGMIALMHTVLIALAEPRIRARGAWLTLGGVLIVSSLSRSVALATVCTLLLSPAVRGAWRTPWRGVAVACAAAAAAAVLFLSPGLRDRTVQTLAPLSERFSLREGSAQSHAFLFDRGQDIATRSIAASALGIGFGSAYRVLADEFAGNKYGNFHSTWLTLWVESGVLSVLIALALMLLPLRRPSPLSGLVIGLVVYNLFYNGIAEPLLWVILALLWVTPELLRGRGATPREVAA